MEQKINNQKTESVNSELPPVPQIKTIELELNKFLKGILIFSLVCSFFNMFGELGRAADNKDINTFLYILIFGSIGMIGAIGMIRKKRWGLLMLFSKLLFELLLLLILQQDSMQYFCSIIFISSILFLRKNGYSGWKTIWSNGRIQTSVLEETNSNS